MSISLSTLPQLFTVDEVAKIFRLTQAAIRRMIRAKELPAIKFGKEYRIPQSVIQNILNPLTDANLKDAGFGLWKTEKSPRGEAWVRKTRDSDTRGLSEYLQVLDEE
jgi:excisionase family DNA binding protein